MQAVKIEKVTLPKGYKPSQDEEYMNPLQLEYFRQKLEAWRDEILAETSETIQHLHDEKMQESDPNDRATLETDTGIELRTRDRYRKLLNKIDAAVERIEKGDYGYCVVSGEEIGIRRLEARPVATMTIEAQEQHEKDEKQMRDFDDDERDIEL